MAFIEFKDVCKSYTMGEVEIKALDNINFSIDNAITSNRMSSVFLNFSNKAVLDKKTNYLLVNRLVAFRKYLNSSNAEAIFKTIFLEMCE